MARPRRTGSSSHAPPRGAAWLPATLTALLAGCGPSAPEPRPPGPPATGKPVQGGGPTPERPPGAASHPDGAPTRAATPLPREVRTPALQVPDPERFRFLVLGDSREASSRCDRHRREPCAAGGGPVADRWVCHRAPAHVLAEVARMLGPHPAPVFALHSGDLVYRGSCARDWDRLRATFLGRVAPWRIFPVPGNHDLWHGRGEPRPEPLFFKAFHHLKASAGKPLGYYAFRVGRTLVVNLESGGYPRRGKAADFLRADRRWNSTSGDLGTQLRWLGLLLRSQAAKGLSHLVVQYHKPSYSCSRHPPLAPGQDPLPALVRLRRRRPDVDVTVISGHNHTTELYVTGGVRVLVAGGAGAPQHLRWGPRACHPKPSRPPERFWAGGRRRHRYNFFVARVSPGGILLEERCLARRPAGYGFERGATVAPDGTVTHRKGACQL